MTERLVLASASLAEDGAYLATADIAELAAATATEYRIIGGQMVSLHAARHPLSPPGCVPTHSSNLPHREM